ncbi:MAG: hypothetical protein Q8K64_10065 [Sediminibacterium sp.]|nr:hypothetical protein [Sediminibacterium sp.]TXT34046.1 MAG: hypothetical protein FD136_570 [Chitinophagaceae bacterium]
MKLQSISEFQKRAIDPKIQSKFIGGQWTWNIDLGGTVTGPGSALQSEMTSPPQSAEVGDTNCLSWSADFMTATSATYWFVHQ